jgi:cytochrome c553
MFSSLENFEDMNTGRRRGKGYAEDAKEYQNEERKSLSLNKVHLSESSRGSSFWSLFCIFFSASSAKPLRLLRPDVWFSALALLALPATAQIKFEGIGRAATPAEIKAWDIDVRPDFKGLPKGQGSVDQGEKIWELQCASCHGSFAESNEVFPPLAGYTNAKDIESHHDDEKFADFYALGLHQPRHALDSAQVTQARRGVCRDRLHAQLGQCGAG